MKTDVAASSLTQSTINGTFYLTPPKVTMTKTDRRGGLTHTGPAGGQFEPWRTLASVAPWYIDALGVPLAQVVPAVTLINICVGGRRRENSVIYRLYYPLLAADGGPVDSRRQTRRFHLGSGCSSGCFGRTWVI